MGDFQPYLTRFLKGGEHFGGFAPGAGTGELDVRHFERDLGFPADAQELFQGLENAHGLISHVAGIHAAMRGGHLGQRDDFLRLGKGARHVDKPGAEPHGAVLHTLLHEGLHRGELHRVGSADEAAAHAFLPDGAVADKRGHIHRDLGFLNLGEELGNIGPRMAAVPGDNRGDAHAQKVLCRRDAADVLRMRVHVHKTRRGHLASGIDGDRRRSLHGPGGDDPPVLHGNAACHHGSAAAIGNLRVGDQKIKVRSVGGPGQQEEENEAQLHG